MQNEILINATPGETRVAILEKKQFVELHIERARSKSVVGSVVKGKVTRVLPGMQAAFVDIGLEKAAFLYAGDYVENIERLDGEEEEGRSRRRRNRKIPSIETLMSEGQEIVVQIAKEPIGTKGARITSHVSIAGRHLVLTPWAQRVGVSRKIDSDRERRRLRDIVNRAKPADLGFIIRTAGEGTRDADLDADVKYLTTVWDDVQIKKDQVRAPANLYEEPSLALRVIRDFANSDTKRVVIDSREAWEEMKAFVDEFVADPKPKIEFYDKDEPIFDHFGAEAEIDTNLGRKVWLKSGGYLIVDQSEALTAIDVNTGRYVGKRDLEETVLRTNLEAVREVVQQLRFRNIGGLIIIDLIDMESAENRDKVYRALQEVIRGDKAKTNILKISELGLVEMTRKRTRENLVQTLCEPCPYCEGKGYVLSDESVAHKLLRELRKDLPRFAGRKIALTVNRRVAEQLLGPERRSLEALEAKVGREMEVRARADLHQEQFEITALEEGEAVELSIPWLTEAPAEVQEESSQGRSGRRRSRKPAAASESEGGEETAEAPVTGTAAAAAAAVGGASLAGGAEPAAAADASEDGPASESSSEAAATGTAATKASATEKAATETSVTEGAEAGDAEAAARSGTATATDAASGAASTETEPKDGPEAAVEETASVSASADAAAETADAAEAAPEATQAEASEPAGAAEAPEAEATPAAGTKQPTDGGSKTAGAAPRGNGADEGAAKAEDAGETAEAEAPEASDSRPTG